MEIFFDLLSELNRVKVLCYIVSCSVNEMANSVYNTKNNVLRNEIYNF